MARVNVYLPDELAARARAAGLNASAVARAALTDRLRAHAMEAWLAEHRSELGGGVSPDRILAAVQAAKDDVERGDRAHQVAGV